MTDLERLEAVASERWYALKAEEEIEASNDVDKMLWGSAVPSSKGQSALKGEKA